MSAKEIPATGPPSGRYDLFFAVNENMDGRIDASRPDMVHVERETGH